MTTSLARWWAAVTVSTPLLGAGTLIALFDRDRGYDVLVRWAATMRRVFGVNLEVLDRNHGRYDSPPYVFVLLNQTSLVESIVTPGALPVRPVRVFQNLEFALIPGLGWLTTALGSVVMLRQWKRQSRWALDRAKRHLGSGDSYYISIEGRRSKGRLLPYKKGPLVLALSAEATIVPMFVRGARERLPVGEWRVRKGNVQVVLCEGIPTVGLRYEDRNALVEELRDIAQRESLASSSA